SPARPQSQARPDRDHRSARSASVPLRDAQPRHPCGAARGRRDGRSARMIANALPLSLTDNPILAQWIAFEPGRVRVATGKVEIGQGIVTALTQIAAEEL